MRHRNLGKKLATAVLTAAVLWAQARSGAAATITVTSTADGVANTANCPGPTCRLRDAIAAAAAGDTIDFAVTGTISLTANELVISQNLTISGPGANLLAISGSNTFRVFQISGGVVKLSGLTIRDGNTTGSPPSNFGGAIRAFNPSLTLEDCSIVGNFAGNGGGIQKAGGTLTVTNCEISGNRTDFQGAAVNLQGVTSATFTNSTISGNTSRLSQAGIIGSTVSLTNCTVTNNVSQAGFAGAFWLTQASLRNTIVAANVPANFSGSTVTSLGNNLDSDGSSGLTNGLNGDLVGTSGSPVNALLAPLGSYGGPTQTHALLPGSPAIDAGSNSACAAAPVSNLDQRGVARPQLTTCDIGAFESRGFALAIAGGNNQATPINTAFPAPLLVSVTANSAAELVDGGRVTFVPPGAGPTATLATSPATIGGGQASVVATANATPGGPYLVGASAAGAAPAVSFSLFNALPSLSLAKTATPTLFGGVGQPITYTLVATNTGNIALSGVTVTDPLVPVLTCTPPQPATLAPTATLTCTGTYVVAPADLVAGAVVNTASASGVFNGAAVLAPPATLRVPAVVPGVSGTRLALQACSVELQQDWSPRYTKLQFEVWNEDEVKFTGAFDCADSWHETDFVTNVDAAQQNFTIAVLGTYGARYRVQAVTSTQCPGARAAGLLGVQSMFLGARAVGTPLAGAGKFTGSIKWDPAGAIPEGGIREPR